MDEAEDLTRVFEKIYAENRWGTGSGPGSAPRNTTGYRWFLENFMRANSVRTVTDLGCGDWQFSSLIDWSECVYTGLDVVPDLIRNNTKQHGRPHIGCQAYKSPNDLPGGDLLISKEVLQHLPNEAIAAILEAGMERYRYLLITNNVEPNAHCNVDIHTGGCRPLRLDRAPFNVPCALVYRHYAFADGAYWTNGVSLIIGRR